MNRKGKKREKRNVVDGRKRTGRIETRRTRREGDV